MNLFSLTMLLSSAIERLSKPQNIIALVLAFAAIIIMVFAKPFAEKLKPKNDEERLNATLRFKMIAAGLAITAGILVILVR